MSKTKRSTSLRLGLLPWMAGPQISPWMARWGYWASSSSKRDTVVVVQLYLIQCTPCGLCTTEFDKDRVWRVFRIYLSNFPPPTNRVMVKVLHPSRSLIHSVLFRGFGMDMYFCAHHESR